MTKKQKFLVLWIFGVAGTALILSYVSGHRLDMLFHALSFF